MKKSFSSLKNNLSIIPKEDDDDYFIDNEYTKLGKATETLLLDPESFSKDFYIIKEEQPSGQVYELSKVLLNNKISIKNRNADKFDDFINVNDQIFNLAYEECGTKSSEESIKERFMKHSNWFYEQTIDLITISTKIHAQAKELAFSIKNKFERLFNKEYKHNIYVDEYFRDTHLHGYVDVVFFDHKKMTIQLVDIKTTSYPNSRRAISKNRYDIQVALYQYLITEMWNDKYEDYDFLLPAILIANTNYPNHPEFFRLTVDDYNTALYGSIRYNTKIDGENKSINRKNKILGLNDLILREKYYNENGTDILYDEQDSKFKNLNLF